MLISNNRRPKAETVKHIKFCDDELNVTCSLQITSYVIIKD